MIFLTPISPPPLRIQYTYKRLQCYFSLPPPAPPPLLHPVPFVPVKDYNAIYHSLPPPLLHPLPFVPENTREFSRGRGFSEGGILCRGGIFCYPGGNLFWEEFFRLPSDSYITNENCFGFNLN